MMTYIPERIKLTLRSPEVENTFAMTIEGSFCEYKYNRRRYGVVQVTNRTGSGQVSPFLTELIWALSSLASELTVRADLQPEEDGGGRDGLVQTLRRMGEDVTLEGPRAARGYEFHTTVKSVEALGLLLEEWPARFLEYFVIYYVRPEELHAFRATLKARAFDHGRPKLVAPFLGPADLIVSDESDRELNLFAIFGRSHLKNAVVRVIDEQCGRFGIRLEEGLGRAGTSSK